MTLAANMAGRNRTDFYKLLNRHGIEAGQLQVEGIMTEGAAVDDGPPLFQTGSVTIARLRPGPGAHGGLDAAWVERPLGEPEAARLHQVASQTGRR